MCGCCCIEASVSQNPFIGKGSMKQTLPSRILVVQLRKESNHGISQSRHLNRQPRQRP
jgi:hypothetical protein